ncbi:hypothetical protein [Pseudomonas sp. NBRC 111140]|uniref:hypothetical protein n=1 Tax=Pseudomonas sp. NBRC 111140 TaxID=1661055 RepID=UPI0007615876|nr:hypothetical protein [Pseudomonas sp. NBRC 111140]
MPTALIDEFYQAVISGKTEHWTLLEERAKECAALRAIICTDHPGAIDLGLSLGVDSNNCILPILLGPRAFFISAMTALKGMLQAGRSSVNIDYSLSFDSNFAEKLKLLINRGAAGTDKELLDVESVLMIKAKNKQVQFDILPFLFENVRLSRESPSNTRPVDTMVAFRVLDHINWAVYQRSRTFQVDGMSLDTLKEKLRPDVENVISEFETSDEFLRHEATALAIETLLLRLAALWRVPNRDPEVIFGQLIDFCNLELGFTPLTELSLIWKAISAKAPAPFLGPLLGSPSTMLKKVTGMAWDIAHLRLLERLAAQKAFGDFYVPFFVSLDTRWRNLLRLNPIRYMFFDDGARMMRSARADEESFLDICHKAAKQDPKRILSAEQSAQRRSSVLTLRIEDMQQLVKKERRRWDRGGDYYHAVADSV